MATPPTSTPAADSLRTIRGIFLDHNPPLFVEIDKQTLLSWGVETPRELRRQLHIAHRACASCNGRDKRRTLAIGIWVPMGRIDLDVAAEHFDWCTLFHVSDDADLLRDSDPRIRIFAADKIRARFHFVVLFNSQPAGEEAEPFIDPSVKFKPTLATKRLRGSFFQVLAKHHGSRRGEESWPVLLEDFRPMKMSVGQVFLDNSAVLQNIEDGLLVKKDGRICAVFSSPCAASARRLFTFLKIYHDLGTKMLYQSLYQELDVSKALPAGERSSHACLVFDFTEMPRSPGFYETSDAFLGNIGAFLWRSVMHFERRYTMPDGYPEQRPPFPYCGGDEVITRLLERVHSLAPTLPVFVIMHGLETLFERPVLASLWANIRHYAVHDIREFLQRSLFLPCARDYSSTSGVIRKILLTGTCPNWIISGTHLEDLVTDISFSVGAVPLHGMHMDDIGQLLECMMTPAKGYQPAEQEFVHAACSRQANAVLRVPRSYNDDQGDELSDYYDTQTVSLLITAAVAALPELDKGLSEDDLYHKLRASALDATEPYSMIQGLVSPLLRGTSDDFQASLRREAVIQLSPLEPGTINFPSGIAATTESIISYDALVTPRSTSSANESRALALLYQFGHLKAAVSSTTTWHASPYELSGPCAAQHVLNMLDSVGRNIPRPSDAVHVRVAPTGGKKRRSALQALLTPARLSELVFARYESYAAANLPLNEQPFQDDLVEDIRRLLAEHGFLSIRVQTEVWVRYPLIVGESCDGRIDILITDENPCDEDTEVSSVPSQLGGVEDYILALELKLRRLDCIKEDTIAGLPRPAGRRAMLRCETTDDHDQSIEYFRQDIRCIAGVDPHSGYFVNRGAANAGPQSRKRQYLTLRLDNIRGSYYVTPVSRSPPQSIKDLVRDGIRQLGKYVTAMSHGVVDELGHRPGVADVRVTKVAKEGSTVIIPILIVNFGCELLHIKELQRGRLDGRVAITGTFPWTGDRGRSEEPPRGAPQGPRAPHWTEPAETWDVLKAKKDSRVKLLCPVAPYGFTANS
ncbi:hypothetical protein AURDEDRAFT_180331 [Auricularia subglabra TFB-10046 SS5]|nr:hypothetical protein AURDEDRAFT_180331 [Auricularia subglabra TFB-10046 SS5]